MQFSSNPDPRTATEPLLEIRLLGRFVVLRGRQEIPAAEFGGRKVRTLVRILATKRGSFVSHDQLTEMLWGDRPPADPAANLQVLVNRARRALRIADVIATGHGGYSMTNVASVEVDIERFQQSLARAYRMSGRDRLDALTAALDLWTGEVLAEDAYVEWAAEPRASLFMLRQAALEAAAQLALDMGDTAIALRTAALAAEAEPLREVAVLTYVRALAAAGDPVAALTRYDVYRHALADELGLDPSAEAVAFQAELLRGGIPDATPTPVSPAAMTFGTLPFVGRRVELDVLTSAVAAGEVALVTGASGVGKSRLIDVLSRSTTLAVVRAFQAEEGEPLSLARRAVRELASADVRAIEQLPVSMRSALGSLAPELLERPVAEFDPESQRALITEAAIRVLVHAPCPLVIDDLQWADASSITVLEMALARRHEHAVILVHRTDGGRLRPEVAQLVARLRTQAAEITLQPLTETEIGELTSDDDLRRQLVEGTDGTPFAVSEVMRSLAADGLIGRASRQRWRAIAPLTDTVAMQAAAGAQRRVIVTRLASLPTSARTVGYLLALLTREAPARLLALASQQPEAAVLDDLGQLAAGGVARLGESGWATAHDLVTEVLVTALDAASRCELETNLARALAEQGSDPGEVARHWRAAGDDHFAAESYLRAARVAVDAFAHGEALDHASAGLGLAPTAQLAAELAEVRATARARLGDLTGARDDFRTALAQHPTGPHRSVILGELAVLASGADDLIRAAELSELALVAAGEDMPARARALEIGATLDMNLDRPDRSRERAAGAEALFRELGDARGLARVLDGRAMATFFYGDVLGGGELLTRVADLFEDSGDLLRVITPRSTAGHALVFAGDPDRALVATNAALDLARSLGYREGQSYALWHTSEALAALGRTSESLAAAQEGLTIAREVDHRGWQATCLRALGIGHQADGNLEAALGAFTESLALSAHLNLFASWAASRTASVLIALDRAAEAGPLVSRALAEGPPLAHYEARVAAAELASALGASDARAVAKAALSQAEAGGYLQGTDRLRSLA